MSAGTSGVPLPPWTLDSSTFIHALVVERVWLLPRVHSPLAIPEYVLRVELNAREYPNTAEEAARFVHRGSASICRLSLDDLDRIAGLSAPRRIGMGEIACAVIAERERGGVLSDDWRARVWLRDRLGISRWESIEDVLVAGAQRGELSEFDLDECEQRLRENRYGCRANLRGEFLQMRASTRRGG